MQLRRSMRFVIRLKLNETSGDASRVNRISFQYPCMSKVFSVITIVSRAYQTVTLNNEIGH